MRGLILANHAFMLPHGELFINAGLQINTAPPQHVIFYRVGPRFNPKQQIASVVVRTTVAAPIRKPIKALSSVAMHPVTKRLTI